MHKSEKESSKTRRTEKDRFRVALDVVVFLATKKKKRKKEKRQVSRVAARDLIAAFLIETRGNGRF